MPGKNKVKTKSDLDKSEQKTTNFRPPVVAVLGHVDHGKTSLLDALRKIDTASREFGGITQHIGAYQIEVENKDGNKKITFIDTPGHETFSKIRSRGVEASDIAILVVAVNDGIQPQTVESIKHIKKSGVPVIVVFTKADLVDSAEKNLKTIKGQLTKKGIEVEDQGGDVVSVLVSAKTGQGLKELLEMILLIAQMNNISGDKNAEVKGVIIESKIDRLRGSETSVIVLNGTLKVGQQIFTSSQQAKVRALINDKGESVSEVFPGAPCKILGFTKAPLVGEPISTKPIEPKEPEIESKNQEEVVQDVSKLFNIILKADSNNSLEAILASLPQTGLKIMLSGLGDISESDVWLAKTTKSFLVGFNVKIQSSAQELAQFEKVKVKTYRVIYELLEEIKEVIEGIAKVEEEQILGQAKILAEFPFNNKKIAGVKVTEGRIARGDKAIIKRGDEELGRAIVKSIRRFKEEINKIEVGNDGGILLEPNIDFKLGDMIVSIQS